MGPREPALRLDLRYTSPVAGPVVEVISLRRPELVLRRTSYHRIVVDERLLTRSFQLVNPPSRLVCVVLLDGVLDFYGSDGHVHLAAGDTALLAVRGTERARWQGTTYLDLEWDDPEHAAHQKPIKLARVDLDQAAQLKAALDDRAADQRATLARGFALFRALGAPVPRTLDGLSGEPSPSDRKLALAMEEQMAHLGSRATAAHIGDSVGLSPRQLQRVVHDFHARYAMNAGNWRDTRNRWRIQIAAVLLSLRDLTVADIAAEVGYASPNALARAFAQAGLPVPAEVRRRLSENDPSDKDPL
jgi:AraC-like DNA-binding protein